MITASVVVIDKKMLAFEANSRLFLVDASPQRQLFSKPKIMENANMDTQATNNAAPHMSTRKPETESGPRRKDFENLDLGPIMFKLTDAQHGEGWSSERAERVAIQYRRFLTLIRENPNTTIVPTEAIDEFWHYHVLDTMKYAEDCKEYFGYFVHHFPYLGLRGDDDVKRLADAFENTKRLYEKRFGESLIPTRESPRADCQAGCGGVVCKIGTCTAEQRPQYKPHLVAA
jgi:hypothetical protein